MDLLFDETTMLLQKDNAHLIEQNFELLQQFKMIKELCEANLNASEKIIHINNWSKRILQDNKL